MLPISGLRFIAMFYEPVAEPISQEHLAVWAKVVQFFVQFREIVRGAHNAPTNMTMGNAEGVSDFMHSDFDHPIQELFPGHGPSMWSCIEPVARNQRGSAAHVCFSEHVLENRIAQITVRYAEYLEAFGAVISRQVLQDDERVVLVSGAHKGFLRDRGVRISVDG